MLAVVALAFGHLGALVLFIEHRTMVNKLTATVFQIAGGLIVLHSLDGNLGLFKKQSLAGALLQWVKEFPRWRAHAVSIGGVGMVGELGIAGSLQVGRPVGSTLEERVSELERRLTETAEQLRGIERSLNERISSVSQTLSNSIASVDATVRELTRKVEHAALGGLKQQLFGVLLAIYGALVGVYA